MSSFITEKQLFEKIRMEVERLGSQAALAKVLAVSRAYVCDLYWERRNPGSERILNYFGLEKVEQPPIYRAAGLREGEKP